MRMVLAEDLRGLVMRFGLHNRWFSLDHWFGLELRLTLIRTVAATLFVVY